MSVAQRGLTIAARHPVISNITRIQSLAESHKITGAYIHVLPEVTNLISACASLSAQPAPIVVARLAMCATRSCAEEKFGRAR